MYEDGDELYYSILNEKETFFVIVLEKKIAQLLNRLDKLNPFSICGRTAL